ncbi:MAG: hypothetical protein ACFB6S_16520 [Geminicoccaceae bacterium]
MTHGLTPGLGLGVTVAGGSKAFEPFGLWRPDSVDGLVRWLDSDHDPSFDTEVSLVSIVRDRGDQGRTLTRTAIEEQPARVPDPTIGRSFLLFGDAKSIGDGLVEQASGAFDLFLTARPAGPTVLGDVATTGENARVGSRLLLAPSETAAPNQVLGLALGTNGVAAIDRAPGTFTRLAQSVQTLSGITLVHLRVQGNQPQLGINGALEAPGLVSAAADLILTGALGDIGDGGTSSGIGQEAGELGELIVFNRILEDEERATIEGYLAHRWSISAKLPNDHDYRHRAPHGPAGSGPSSGGGSSNGSDAGSLLITETQDAIATDTGELVVVE